MCLWEWAHGRDGTPVRRSSARSPASPTSSPSACSGGGVERRAVPVARAARAVALLVAVGVAGGRSAGLRAVAAAHRRRGARGRGARRGRRRRRASSRASRRELARAVPLARGRARRWTRRSHGADRRPVGRVGAADGARPARLRRRPPLGQADDRAPGRARRARERSRGSTSPRRARCRATRTPVAGCVPACALPFRGDLVGLLGRADRAAELPRRRARPAPRLRPRRLAARRHASRRRDEERRLLGVGEAAARARRRRRRRGRGRRPRQPAAGRRSRTAKAPAGNHVVLDLGNGEYALLAHLQRGSVRVEAGDRVRAGDVLGLTGNSGNSSEPHLHFHVQDRPGLFGGRARAAGRRSSATAPTAAGSRAARPCRVSSSETS